MHDGMNEKTKSGGPGAPRKVQSHCDLDVYARAMEAAMQVFELSKDFPGEERYSLTNQIRRSSRSICANIAEAWRKRRYEAAFVSRLSDAEAEAAETQVWIEFAVKCGYLQRDIATELFQIYDAILRMLVAMIHRRASWILTPN